MSNDWSDMTSAKFPDETGMAAPMCMDAQTKSLTLELAQSEAARHRLESRVAAQRRRIARLLETAVGRRVLKQDANVNRLVQLLSEGAGLVFPLLLDLPDDDKLHGWCLAQNER